MQFKTVNTPVIPTDEPTALVLSGPFTFTRNPMYLGMVLILTGIAVWKASWPMFIAPPAFFLIINSFFLPYEERKMERIFGKQYLDYKKQVRPWI